MRRLLVAVGFLACALAGCSGSGGTANAVSPPAPTSTPSPTPTPAPDPHPAVDNSTVTFISDVTTVRTPAGGQPTTSSSTVTTTETIHTAKTFNGHVATDVHVASSDGNSTGDNYAGYVATSAGQNFVTYGTVTTDAKRQYTRTQVNTNPSIIDEVPEITGASWANSVAASFTISQGPATNHTDDVDVRNEDGSEVDTTTYSDGNAADAYTDTLVTNANGTGTEKYQDSTGTTQYSVGVPIQQGSALVIPITYTDKNGTQSYTVPDWYPGNGLPAAPFGTAVSTDLGVEMPPAACSKGPQIPATHVRAAQTYLDLFGSTGTIVEDFFFTPTRGLICYIGAQADKEYDYTTGALLGSSTFTNVNALTGGVGVLSRERRPTSAALPYAFLSMPSLLSRDAFSHRRAAPHR